MNHNMTTPGRTREIFFGSSGLHPPESVGDGTWVDREGERYYRISNPHAMAPFLVTVVSGYDHWLFVSSTGGLTCGRGGPENALFPYCTDDKLHDAASHTGPTTAVRVERGDRTMLWLPFHPGPCVYRIERGLYKNVPGSKLLFEEVNHDLGLAFAYTWTTGKRFGFIRRSRLRNTGGTAVRAEILDGLRNLLPYGVDRHAQAEMSTLVDAYKQAEAVPDACAAVFTLSSIPTDRPEPVEALKATVAWSTGLTPARVLVSGDQVGAFCAGEEIRAETAARGKRGAFLVHSPLDLRPGEDRLWYVVADVARGPSQAADLLHAVKRGVPADAIEEDVAAGTARLEHLVGSADGFQKTADEMVTARHFSNTLFNIMRGGVFPYGYRFPTEDFLTFVAERNRSLKDTVEHTLRGVEGPLTLDSARRLAEESGDPDVLRLVHEYLPLTFSRRHGDPSRPWNHFSITLRNGNGGEYLCYQGNWRDIFQNWEALALSFPEYVESFVFKFVNASTPDGHNAYRISREGIDWEVLESGNSWSNIGYWGDHQVGYLFRLVELSRNYHPGRLDRMLTRDVFVYADVPYRIKSYRQMCRDPRNTVEYDHERASAIARRVDALGSDGKLVSLEGGSILRVNLLEKLLVAALARIVNLAPGGGIWMNTQRPEWNDANNALVGYGLSMVTLGYLRRYLGVLGELLEESASTSFPVSREVARFLRDADGVMADHAQRFLGPVSDAGRKSFMDAMGEVADTYRRRAYEGFCGEREPLAKAPVLDFLNRALAIVDHSISLGRREDGLYHSYNLIHFGSDGHGVEPLDEMLEGQVAVLSSGYLDGRAALGLLDALKASRLYRADRNSYLLYPNRSLPRFLERNVIPADAVERNGWIRSELNAGRTAYVERDRQGRVHFNGDFRNGNELRAALRRDPEVRPEDAARLCDLYESVFQHRKFTGRSGSMYKYEGLGCIYWHMVSKLLLATGEAIDAAVRRGDDPAQIDGLVARFTDIQEGLGVHEPPVRYGAFPLDPHSHTPEFGGVQQPGLTGQVKEDLITRFRQLGVRVSRGEVSFEPVLLHRGEFLMKPAAWRYTFNGNEVSEDLPAGSLGFTLCGVPVVYRLSDSARITVHGVDGLPNPIQGCRIGTELSRSLFRRDGRIRRLVVDLSAASLR